MALLAGSPALGQGIPADIPGTTTPIATDQRGLVSRGGTVDIGAFQANLVVETNAGTVATAAASLSLPGAVSLADQFPGDTITFAAGLSGTILLDSPLPDITADVTIVGPAR